MLVIFLYSKKESRIITENCDILKVLFSLVSVVSDTVEKLHGL